MFTDFWMGYIVGLATIPSVFLMLWIVLVIRGKLIDKGLYYHDKPQ